MAVPTGQPQASIPQLGLHLIGEGGVGTAHRWAGRGTVVGQHRPGRRPQGIVEVGDQIGDAGVGAGGRGRDRHGRLNHAGHEIHAHHHRDVTTQLTTGQQGPAIKDQFLHIPRRQ